jgi:hypothetical protein
MDHRTIAATGETYMSDVETQRLNVLMDDAEDRLNKAISEFNQSQIDAANGRTLYFERLTIGAGAVIAAIISFLGVHASTLHPEWSLRCSLVSLTVAILAGLYRSYRYPYYIMQVRKVIYNEAASHHQKIQCEHIMASRVPSDINTGKLIDKDKLSEDFRTRDAQLDTITNIDNKKCEHLLKECNSAEVVCVASIAVAMVSLVWLALCTF